jgi:hypothetical protein
LKKAGTYNFEYLSLVVDKNGYANGWANSHYNLQYIPSCYYDGGESVRIGGYGADTAVFAWPLRTSGQREVPDIDLDVSMTWISTSQIEVTVSVTNNNFVNTAPDGPDAPLVPDAGLTNEEIMVEVSATDPDGDDLYYQIDWDGEMSAWMGPYTSGEVVQFNHAWPNPGEYSILVKAKDIWDEESPWSNNSAPIKLVDRGDANGDNDLNVADAVFMINYVFNFGAPPVPVEAGDANCDGNSDVADAVYLINTVFNGGPPPGCPE